MFSAKSALSSEDLDDFALPLGYTTRSCSRTAGSNISILRPFLSLFIKWLAIKITDLESLDIATNGNLAEGGQNPAAGDPLASYIYAIKSMETRKQYCIRLRYYFEFLGLKGSLPDQARIFLGHMAKDQKWAADSFVSFLRHLKDRVDNRDLTGGTLNNYYAAVKLFYEMNDIELNWRKITRGLPAGSKVAN